MTITFWLDATCEPPNVAPPSSQLLRLVTCENKFDSCATMAMQFEAYYEQLVNDAACPAGLPGLADQTESDANRRILTHCSVRGQHLRGRRRRRQIHRPETLGRVSGGHGVGIMF